MNMELFKKENWYNPFFCVVGNNERPVHNILVFDSTGIIAETRCGWFGGGNNNIPSLKIDCEIVKKLNPDFNLKNAFALSYKDTFGELEWDIYIPATILGAKKPIYTKENNGFAIKKTIETNFNGVMFESYKSLDKELCKLCQEMEETGKEIATYKIYHNKNAISEIEAIIKKLQVLKKKYAKELERVLNTPIEEF